MDISTHSNRKGESMESGEDKTVRIDEDIGTVKIGATGDSGVAPMRQQRLGNADFHSLYAIQAKVGGGGMGVVYLAKDLRLGRFVAVKRLNATANCDASLRKRFLNEAHAVATLNHIHIVHIYALGEDDEGPYIAMEYVEGPAATSGSRKIEGTAHAPNAPLSLEAQVAENGQYTLNEALDLVVKITKAIAYAHACGVIHRDLKPSNILLDTAGEPKIVDFGLARRANAAESKLTGPGEKLLSIGYGAPEQESDASVSDERADVYGLGGILFFAITGQNPRYFREQDIPVTIRETLVKALATDREQRWPTAQSFLEALQAVQSRTRIEQPPAKTTWRCKWCDTINPVTIRFCSECGWDGVEQCPECGAENVVGMQFCGKCGADVRVYESMQSLATKMHAATDSDEYEKAVSLSSRAQGFDPAGPSGRSLLQEIHDLGEHAKRQIARREQLKDLIPMELKAENYERARNFIEEYRRLSGNSVFYAEEYNRIPDHIVRRDFRRACRAYRTGEAERALDICETILTSVSPENPEFLSLRRRIVSHKYIRGALRAIAVVFLIALAYVASFPPVVAAGKPEPMPRTLALFYVPAQKLYTSSWDKLGGVLGAYALKCKCAETDVAAAIPVEKAEPPPVNLAENSGNAEPKVLTDLLAEHTAAMAKIEDDFSRKISEWPAKYMEDLEKMSNERRMAGDFAGYNAAIEELERFEREQDWKPADDSTHKALADLQKRHVELIAKYKKERENAIETQGNRTISTMQNLLSKFTKENDIAAARAVNNELIKLVGGEKEGQN